MPRRVILGNRIGKGRCGSDPLRTTPRAAGLFGRTSERYRFRWEGNGHVARSEAGTQNCAKHLKFLKPIINYYQVIK